MAESKRELIMAEVKRRLKLAYPTAGVDRGFFADNVDKYNQFYIFDMPETSVPERRGQYTASFTVSISYFLQADPTKVYSLGNQHLETIRLAIELDEMFKDPNGKSLAIDYEYSEGALLWYEPGVLDVELMFEFKYTKDAGWLRKPFTP